MYAIGFFFGGGQRMVQNEPGMFIGPIASVFGYIIDVIFNIIYNNITVYHSLGFSIIALTVIVRTLMLPLAVKQQKSMMAMQRLTPEMQKIKKKYSGRDKESQQRMNAEIQKLYADNKVNPLGGCLPLFIQMPLFFGLSFIMQQSYLYVTRLGTLYSQISEYLITQVHEYYLIIGPLATPRVPDRVLNAPIGERIDISIVSHMNRVLNAFDIDDWHSIFNQLPAHHYDNLRYLYDQKTVIENFMGLALTEATGAGWPGIMIPILAVLSAALTSWVSMKVAVVTDENARRQQKIMMAIMPIMMGVMTIGLPAGVGIFWITSSVYQVGQQLVINRRSGIGLFTDNSGKEIIESKQ